MTIYQHKSSSLYHLDHARVLVIFKSYSSSSHLHLQVIFIFKSSSYLNLDHHWNIITRFGSSLDLDHHLIWIITVGSSSLDHHGCYLMILLIIGSSIEPALFHARCRPSHHVGLLLCLYLTLKSEWPPITYI